HRRGSGAGGGAAAALHARSPRPAHRVRRLHVHEHARPPLHHRRTPGAPPRSPRQPLLRPRLQVLRRGRRAGRGPRHGRAGALRPRAVRRWAVRRGGIDRSPPARGTQRRPLGRRRAPAGDSGGPGARPRPPHRPRLAKPRRLRYACRPITRPDTGITEGSTMRRLYVAASAAAALALVPAGAAQAQDDSRTVAGGGILIEGWQGRIDAREAQRGGTLEGARLAKEGDALHVVTGPAVAYWNPSNTASGNYTVKATFREPEYMALNNHPHPYGVFIAG